MKLSAKHASTAIEWVEVGFLWYLAIVLIVRASITVFGYLLIAVIFCDNPHCNPLAVFKTRLAIPFFTCVPLAAAMLLVRHKLKWRILSAVLAIPIALLDFSPAGTLTRWQGWPSW